MIYERPQSGRKIKDFTSVALSWTGSLLSKRKAGKRAPISAAIVGQAEPAKWSRHHVQDMVPNRDLASARWTPSPMKRPVSGARSLAMSVFRGLGPSPRPVSGVQSLAMSIFRGLGPSRKVTAGAGAPAAIVLGSLTPPVAKTHASVMRARGSDRSDEDDEWGDLTTDEKKIRLRERERCRVIVTHAGAAGLHEFGCTLAFRTNAGRYSACRIIDDMVEIHCKQLAKANAEQPSVIDRPRLVWPPPLIPRAAG